MIYFALSLYLLFTYCDNVSDPESPFTLKAKVYRSNNLARSIKESFDIPCNKKGKKTNHCDLFTKHVFSTITTVIDTCKPCSTLYYTQLISNLCTSLTTETIKLNECISSPSTSNTCYTSTANVISTHLVTIPVLSCITYQSISLFTEYQTITDNLTTITFCTQNIKETATVTDIITITQSQCTTSDNVETGKQLFPVFEVITSATFKSFTFNENEFNDISSILDGTVVVGTHSFSFSEYTDIHNYNTYFTVSESVTMTSSCSAMCIPKNVNNLAKNLIDFQSKQLLDLKRFLFDLPITSQVEISISSLYIIEPFPWNSLVVVNTSIKLIDIAVFRNNQIINLLQLQKDNLQGLTEGLINQTQQGLSIYNFNAVLSKNLNDLCKLASFTLKTNSLSDEVQSTVICESDLQTCKICDDLNSTISLFQNYANKQYDSFAAAQTYFY